MKVRKNSKFFCAQRIDEPNCKNLIRWVHLSVIFLNLFGCGLSALGNRIRKSFGYFFPPEAFYNRLPF